MICILMHIIMDIVKLHVGCRFAMLVLIQTLPLPRWKKKAQQRRKQCICPTLIWSQMAKCTQIVDCFSMCFFTWRNITCFLDENKFCLVPCEPCWLCNMILDVWSGDALGPPTMPKCWPKWPFCRQNRYLHETNGATVAETHIAGGFQGIFGWSPHLGSGDLGQADVVFQQGRPYWHCEAGWWNSSQYITCFGYWGWLMLTVFWIAFLYNHITFVNL